MIKNYQHNLVYILWIITLISCEKEIEVPVIQFNQKAVVSATSATLLFDSQYSLSEFDEAGYLIGKSKELVFDEAEKLMLHKDLDDQQYATVENLLPGQTYFFSFYTITGESVKVYEAVAFTTYQKNTWAKRAVHPKNENINSGYHLFKAGSNFYFGGGTDRSDRYVRDLYEYNTTLDKWLEKGDIPGKMYSAEFTTGTEIANGKAVIITKPINSKTNYAYIYDSNTNNWTLTNTVSDSLYFEPVFSSNMLTVNKQAYLFGYGITKAEGYNHYHAYRYNEANTLWEVVTDHDRMEMYYPKAAVADGYIFIASRSIRNEIHKIDLVSGATTMQSIAIPTEESSVNDMTHWKDGIVAVQGRNLFYYDAVNNSWSELPQGNFRNVRKVFVDNERIFIYSSYENCFYEYLS